MVNRKEPRRQRGNFNRGVMRFTEWKQQAVDLMLADEKLVKLLAYDTKNALSRESLSEEEAIDLLVDKRIFQYRYNPYPVDTTGSFISMGLSHFVPQEGFRQFSDDYLMGYLYIYILVDTEIAKVNEGVRQDQILERIYEIFQENRDFGMGELRLETCVELWQHNNKFGGYTAGFRVTAMK